MNEKYSQPLVLQLVDQIEGLVLHNESLQRQLDAVDATLYGTRHNWQGTGKGRVEVLEQLVKGAS